jgi:hypothetical protein
MKAATNQIWFVGDKSIGDLSPREPSFNQERAGSAPQASETVFREGPDDIVCGVQKAFAPANVGWKPKPGGPQNWRVQSARARGFTPDAVPTRKTKKEWKQMRTQPTRIRENGGSISRHQASEKQNMDPNCGKRRSSPGRRGFLKTAGAALGASVFVVSNTAASSQEAAPESIAHAGAARPQTEKEKLARIASNTWPIRYIFKTRSNFLAEEQTVAQMKKKYGEITNLPQRNKEQRYTASYHARRLRGFTPSNRRTEIGGNPASSSTDPIQQIPEQCRRTRPSAD